MRNARHRPLAGLAALALAGLPVAAGATPPRPQRIVSLDLCSDQLVLALADRSQIAGLTVNADRPELSAAAARARGLRILDASAEEILAIEPDLVVGMPVRRRLTGMLRHQRYRALDLASTETLDQIYAAIRRTAGAVGHPGRGDRLVANMQRDLAAVPRPGRGRVAAYYQRRGYMTGTGTLIDDLMRRLGLVNLAGRLGKPALAQLSLEELVAARPDFLIVESETDHAADLGAEMLDHPALRHIPRLSVPQAWTVCGTPAYTAAARSLAAQIATHDGGR